jgi:hypothetical protein
LNGEEATWFFKNSAQNPLNCLRYREGVDFRAGDEKALPMSERWLLSEPQIRRIEPNFPLSHGIWRVDDRRIVSGIIDVIRVGPMWRDAPKARVGC